MDSPLRHWLAAKSETIAGCEAVYVVLGSAEHAPGALREHWPAGAPVSAPLSATLAVALERGQLSTQSSAAAAPGAALAHVAVPIRLDGAVCGAVAATARVAMPGDTKTIADRLGDGAALLASVVGPASEVARAADMLGVASTLLDHARLAPASHELADALAHRFGCERVSIGVRSGKRVRVVALSTSVRFSRRGDGLRALRAAMEEALDQDDWTLWPEPGGGVGVAVADAHRGLATESGAAAIATLPLGARGLPSGAITLEWRDAPAAPSEVRARVQTLGRLAGPLLELIDRADAGLFARARAGWSRFVERRFGSERLARFVVAAALAALALTAVVPGDYRVSARASLEGRVQRALVAAVPGYLAEAHARAGDLVSEGQLLARLDDRDIQLEIRKWQSQRTQLEREYREALAQLDRTQISILRARIDQASAQLGLAEESLARTRVFAPFDGIVLEGDLDRSLGSPVERGSVLFEIAPLDGYRIIVEVDGRDIADVSVGQPGRLTLSALPDEPMSLVVERITPISTVRDGRNYFRVEAALDRKTDALRPGMEGIAKIEAGERRLLWIWTHELLDWLRLQLWSFMP